MGKDVTSTCLGILNDHCLIQHFNMTSVVLIPKKKIVDRFRDFRHIALTNVIYKSVTKCMANRLKPMLQSLIASN